MLDISYNDTLSNCAVQSVCDYLASPTGTIQIEYNATGCDSIAEVDSACAYLSNSEVNLQSAFRLYPNPTSTNITIETPAQSQLSILNLHGQELITRQITEPKTQIDISSLPAGVYFVRLTGERTVKVGKIVKQ